MRLLPIVVVCLALGCSKPVPPTIAPDSATVTAVDPQGIHLNVTLTATNTNSVDLPVQDVTAHVVLGPSLDLGTVTLPKAVNLPAGKTTKLDLPIQVQWSDMVAVAQLAANLAPVPFTVDGMVELGGPLLHVSVPFQIKGSMTHDQLVTAVSRSVTRLLH